MKHLLSRASIGLIEAVGAARSLLAFDFDGTLAPIVADRGAAWMTAKTASLLARVADLYPCAVISGRGRADVARRLGAANVKHVVGNHGLESAGADLDALARRVERARSALEAALGGSRGVEIEDKRYSLSLHYRGATSKRLALREISAAVAGLDADLRAVPGKLVVNLVPVGAPNKADALLDLRLVEQADVAVYFGDDVTDEDVFELDQPGLVSVRIGASRASAAQYFLRSQLEIDEVLGRLEASRVAGSAISPARRYRV